VASRVPEFNAVVDLWGGGVVASPEQPTPKRPVAVIDLTPNLNAPILGLFGNDDRGPNPAQVDVHEAALKEHGKMYFFHRYDGAGHGFFYYHNQSYRQQQAMDGWNKVFAFFDQYLA
jgi:carboxymethylenebutenolidase